MALADDINTMVALADAEVDKWLTGHADTDLANLYILAQKHVDKRDINVLPLLLGLIGGLIDKVYDIQNP